MRTRVSQAISPRRLRPHSILVSALALSALTSAAFAQPSPPSGSPGAPPAQPNREVVVPAPQVGPAPERPADPRTIQQRDRDRRAFERCVLRARARDDDNAPYNPLAPDPVELCRQKTSMLSGAAAPTRR